MLVVPCNLNVARLPLYELLIAVIKVDLAVWIILLFQEGLIREYVQLHAMHLVLVLVDQHESGIGLLTILHAIHRRDILSRHDLFALAIELLVFLPVDADDSCDEVSAWSGCDAHHAVFDRPLEEGLINPLLEFRASEPDLLKRLVSDRLFFELVLLDHEVNALLFDLLNLIWIPLSQFILVFFEIETTKTFHLFDCVDFFELLEQVGIVTDSAWLELLLDIYPCFVVVSFPEPLNLRPMLLVVFIVVFLVVIYLGVFVLIIDVRGLPPQLVIFSLRFGLLALLAYLLDMVLLVFVLAFRGMGL